MKEINLPIRHTVAISFTSADVMAPESRQLGAVKLPHSANEVSTAQSNGGKILYAATDIAQQIEDIVCDYLFGTSPYPSPQKNFFRNEIAQSSSFSFQFKKEILQRIINEGGLLQGKEKNQFQNNLASIMLWRNAFAHGKLKFDDKKGVLLEYYSNSNKTLELNDSFWESVEYAFNETIKCLKKISEGVSLYWKKHAAS